MDYPELIAEITRRVGDPEVPARASLFVTLAEGELSKRLQVGDTEMTTTVSTDDDGNVDLPPDFGQMRAIFRPDGRALPMTPIPSIGQMNDPGYYVQGRTLKTTLPDTELRLEYYATIPPLAIYGSNWLLDREPSIYLKAVEKQVYIDKDDVEKVGKAEAVLSGLINIYIGDDLQRRFGDMKYQPQRVWP